jgi:hypothetical protein
MASEIESPMKSMVLEESSRRRRFGGQKMKGLRRFKARKAFGSMFGSFRSSRTINGSADSMEDTGLRIANSRSNTIAQWEAQTSPKTLESCMELLESSNIDENRKGLQLLSLLTKAKFVNPISGGHLSHAIAYSGDDDSMDSRLRELLLPFLSDNDKIDYNRDSFSTSTFDSNAEDGRPQDKADNKIDHDDDSFSNSSFDSAIEDDCPRGQHMDTLQDIANCLEQISPDDSTENRLKELLLPFVSEDREIVYVEDSFLNNTFDSDEEDERPRGQHWGVLHGPALRVIINCLDQISSEKNDSKTIDFSSKFWKTAVSSLFHNIEMGHSADISGYSLRCFRLLQTIEPDTVTPLLQHNLLPFLVNLKEYGEQQNYPMIQDETTRLLKRAIRVCDEQ